MLGTIVSIDVDGKVTATTINGRPELKHLKQGIGGGRIEIVPFFDSYCHEGADHDCVAFCDEEGKLKGFPRNEYANLAWDRALTKNRRSRFDSTGQPLDELVGTIAIVFGDGTFMREL